MCCAAVAAYNYARFGDPLEFGLKYQLTGGADYQNVRLSGVNLLPSLYYFLEAGRRYCICRGRGDWPPRRSLNPSFHSFG